MPTATQADPGIRTDLRLPFLLVSISTAALPETQPDRQVSLHNKLSKQTETVGKGKLYVFELPKEKHRPIILLFITLFPISVKAAARARLIPAFWKRRANESVCLLFLEAAGWSPGTCDAALLSYRFSLMLIWQSNSPIHRHGSITKEHSRVRPALDAPGRKPVDHSATPATRPPHSLARVLRTARPEKPSNWAPV